MVTSSWRARPTCYLVPCHFVISNCLTPSVWLVKWEGHRFDSLNVHTHERNMDWRHVLLPQYCIGYLSAVDIEWSFPISFQCRLYSTMLFQCHSGVGCYKSQSLQWCFSAGCNSKSFSSGVPVWDSFNYVYQWCSSVSCKYSLVSPGGIPVYTELTSGIPVAFQCTLDQPACAGSG